MSKINGKINRKKLVAIFVIIFLVIGVVYILSMQNPVINASIFNAVYYKEGSYQEKIVIDGIVYFDSQKGVVNISELERKGLKITGEGDYSASVKLNNDIDVLICDDGKVYINKISNVQNHDIYVFGITNESDCYDMLKMYGLSVFDEKEHDIAIYGIECVANNPMRLKKILKHEDFVENNSIGMWNYYWGYGGDNTVSITFDNDAISEIELTQITDL